MSKYSSLITAVILLGGFAWVTSFMIGEGKTLPATDQYKWERLLSIFNAVQTLAVAAAGVLLGTTVQQGRVAIAEASAKANAEDASKANAVRETLNRLQPPGGRVAPTADDIDLLRRLLS